MSTKIQELLKDEHFRAFLGRGIAPPQLKTCTVVLKNGDNHYDYYGYCATTLIDNQLAAADTLTLQAAEPCDVTIENVACGSTLVVGMKGAEQATFISIDGDAQLKFYGGSAELFPATYLFNIGETENEIITITFYGAKA